MQSSALRLVVSGRPERVVDVPGGFSMVVDRAGMNCVRHDGDRFPCIFERAVAEGILNDAKRKGMPA